MNFFGHAVAALRLGHGPRTVLGAMLPDLAGMCGLRLRSCADDEVAAGIELHYVCDALFHREPTFLELVARGRQRLRALGLRTGPARAVSHVGIEMLCDGVLSGDREAVQAYREALKESDRLPLAATLTWNPEDDRRFRELRDRLAAAPLPAAYRDPDATSVRLEGALRRRPRLALDSGEVALVQRWLVEADPEVRAAAEPLIAATLARVRNGGAVPTPR